MAIAEALDLLSTVTVETVDASAVTSSIDEAVSAADLEPEVQADASGVTAAIDEAVGAADADVAVGADASSIPDSIATALDEADTTLTVDAITDGITDQINAAIADADSVVEVEADTSAAEEQIAGLGDAAQETGGKLSGAGAGAEAFGALSAASAGSVGGLTSQLGKLGTAGPIAAAGVTGIALSVGELFSAALEADTADRRFASSLGLIADQVAAINIDGFADDLNELAEKTGSSDEALKLAAARLADLGNSAGASQGQIAGAAENITLLATRATVLNPTLGDAGAVADQLTNALARGGRALAPFGFNLSTAAIQARAVADAGGDAAAGTDRFALAAAGAALVTEQLGSRLKSDIVDGAGGAEIRLRSLQEQFGNTLETLGQPLLDPVLEAITAAQPLLLDLASIFRDLGTVAVPLATKALQGLAGPLKLVAGASGLVGQLVGAVRRQVTGLDEDAEEAEEPVVDLATGLDGLRRVSGDIPDVTNRLIAAVKAETAAAIAAAAAQNDLVDAHISALDSTLDNEQAHRDFGDTLDEVNRTGAAKFKQGLEDEAQAARDAEEALNGLLDAQIGFLDSSIGAEEAARRLSDALQTAAQQSTLISAPDTSQTEEAQKAQAAFAGTVRDVRDAALSAAKADLRLAEDRAKANGGTLTATQRQEAFAASLRRSAEQASGPAQDAILALVNTYESLPRNIETKVTADTTEAQKAQDDYAGAIRNAREVALKTAEADLALADARATAADRILTPTERQNIFAASLQATADKANGPVRSAILDTIALYDSIPTGLKTEFDADTTAATDKVGALAALVKSDVLVVATKSIDANIDPAKAKVKELSALIKSDLQTVLAFTGPNAPRLPGAMAGGTFGPGLLVVGEAGREIVQVQQGTTATVTPNRQTEALLGGGTVLDPGLSAAIQQLAAQPRFAVDLGVVAMPGSDPYPLAMETARQLASLSTRLAAQT